MLAILAPAPNRTGYCDGVSRRNFLRIGALGLGGLTLPQLLRAEAQPGDEEILAGTNQPPKIGGGTSDPAAMSAEGHRRLVEDLVGAIREKRSPMIPGAEARRAVESF